KIICTSAMIRRTLPKTAAVRCASAPSAAATRARSRSRSCTAGGSSSPAAGAPTSRKRTRFARFRPDAPLSGIISSHTHSMTDLNSTADTAARIASLNDTLRRQGIGGKIVVTNGFLGKGGAFVAKATEAIQAFSAFTEDNDPYGEHDFGSVVIDEETVFW